MCLKVHGGGEREVREGVGGHMAAGGDSARGGEVTAPHSAGGVW